MPSISYEASIDVYGSPDSAYGLVASDLVATQDDTGEIGGRRPLTDGPLRSGFQWVSTYRHARHLCTSYWTVSAVDPGRSLTQSMHHVCMVSRREIRGGERWEFAEAGDGSTLVTLRSWREAPGLAGWMEKLFGSSMRRVTLLGLRSRLSYVQFRVENPR